MPRSTVKAPNLHTMLDGGPTSNSPFVPEVGTLSILVFDAFELTQGHPLLV